MRLCPNLQAYYLKRWCEILWMFLQPTIKSLFIKNWRPYSNSSSDCVHCECCINRVQRKACEQNSNFLRAFIWSFFLMCLGRFAFISKSRKSSWFCASLKYCILPRKNTIHKTLIFHLYFYKKKKTKKEMNCTFMIISWMCDSFFFYCFTMSRLWRTLFRVK